MNTKSSHRQPDTAPRIAHEPVSASTHRKPRLARWKAPLITIIVAAFVLTLAGVHGPAEAASTLVTNLAETSLITADREKMSVNDFAMPFTTGTNTSGYQLESISFDFAVGGSRKHDPVYVYLQKDGGNGRPGAHLATLTRNGINYLGPVSGVNKYTIWEMYGCCPRAAPVHLDANTTYWVYIWAGEQATTAQLSHTGGAESGATGWSIGNSALIKPQGTASSNYTQVTGALKMKVEGTTNAEVTVSVSDARVTEGVELTADFVVSLNRATSGLVTVEWETDAGTASDGQDPDYYADDGTLTFQPGETQKTISIVVDDDARAESDDTFDLDLANVKGATLLDATGTATIVNADPLALSISDATATEGVDVTMDFAVTLNRATNRTVTVNLLFSSGTADFTDIEYVQTEQSVTFAPGETEKTYSIGIVDDTVNEPSETFDIVVQTSVPPDLLILADSLGKGTILNTEILTASFENVPQDHDGSTAFTFNVAFNNDISIIPDAMRDHAFTVTNGDVTDAEHVNGSSARWLITVDPDGDDAVTITLPGNRACATQGAICSHEDNPVQLGNSPSATVAAPPEGDPLTASFSNIPDSHNGNDFFIDLTFSEGPDVSWRDVKNALSVSRGSINRVNRETQGSNVSWHIKVLPAGTGELTITLPATTNCNSSGAICTTDDRGLSNSLSVTIAEASAVVETTPSISIAGGSGTEGANDSIAFTVTLDEAANGTVTVDYATSDGSADAGDDYTAKSGTLSFSAGDTSKTISVAIKDDIENESDETFTVTLSNASGADLGTTSATCTIRNRHVATLTASFSNVPSIHDGSTEFTFDLSFSENVKAGYQRIRDDAFSITGGTIDQAQRVTQGSNQNWTITVQPDGSGAISITLPATTDCDATGAICTYDGRKLSHSTPASIAGPQTRSPTHTERRPQEPCWPPQSL